MTDRTGRTLLGVSAVFCAAHHDPFDVLGQAHVHGHTYKVTAWFQTPGPADARLYRQSLQTLLSTWDHKLLPPELTTGEQIAAAVGILNNCVMVRVDRDLEGFHALWVADGAPMQVGA